MAKVKSAKAHKLPSKPSALIRLALADLRAVEKSKKYVVNMGKYHGADLTGKCEVCFAGAVMAMSLGAAISVEMVPTDFPVATKRKLEALNYFRCGMIGSALAELGLKRPGSLATSIQVDDYGVDPARFKKDMAELADHLERNGL